MAKKSTETGTTTQKKVVKKQTRNHKLNFKAPDEVEYSVIKYDNSDIVE